MNVDTNALRILTVSLLKHLMFTEGSGTKLSVVAGNFGREHCLENFSLPCLVSLYRPFPQALILSKQENKEFYIQRKIIRNNNNKIGSHFRVGRFLDIRPPEVLSINVRVIV